MTGCWVSFNSRWSVSGQWSHDFIYLAHHLTHQPITPLLDAPRRLRRSGRDKWQIVAECGSHRSRGDHSDIEGLLMDCLIWTRDAGVTRVTGVTSPWFHRHLEIYTELKTYRHTQTPLTTPQHLCYPTSLFRFKKWIFSQIWCETYFLYASVI